MVLSPGEEFGAYRIVGPIDKGGMAWVYRAYQPSLDREVALKVIDAELATEAGFRARFRREAAVVARLEHPGILAVYDYGEIGDQAFIVYRLVRGGTLASLLGRPLPLGEVVALLTPVAAALDFAHSQGIVHRDVKPANVLLTPEREPIVGDFGLARIFAQEPGEGEQYLSLTEVGRTLGTPAYMSPEQVTGRRLDGRSDQYSLAVVAYQMLAGEVPFRAETPMAVAMMHVYEPVPPALSAALGGAAEAALLRALAKAPADRYPTCTAFMAALAAAAETDALAATAEIAAVVRGAVASGQGGDRQPADADEQNAARAEDSVRRRGRPLRAPAVAAAIVAVFAAVAVVAGVLQFGGGRSHRKQGVAAAGTANVATTATAALLVDTMADPEQGLLPSSATFTEFPGYALGYQNGEYVWKNDPTAGNMQPAILFSGDYADVVLAVDARVVGDTADRTIGLGCRTPGYHARIDVGAGMFTIEKYLAGEPNQAGRQSSIPLIDWQATPAIRPGNGFNTIALRCMGSTIALAVNGVEVAAIVDSAYSHGALFLGMGGHDTAPVGIEAHLRNLVIANLAAPTGGTPSPLTLPGWPASLTPPAAAPDSPVVTDLRVYDNAVNKREGEFQVTDGALTCFTLTPGKLVTPLTVVASDAAGPRPRNATDTVVVARSAPVPPTVGAKCIAVSLLKQLVPLHTYRVELLANGVSLAGKTFSNAAGAADVLFADDLGSAQAGKLPVRTDVAAFPDLRESYEDGAFVVRNTFAAQQTIEPYTLLPDTYTDAALVVGVRLPGASVGRHVYLACRVGHAGGYILDVVPAFGLVGLFRQDIADQPRRIPLITPQPNPAVNRGNELNRIVLRCAGSTISAAINGREVLTVADTTFASGFFGFTAMGAAGNAAVEAHFSNLVVVKQ